MHTCAVTTSGEALCWGSDQFNQLGYGETTSSSVPGTVTGLSSGVMSISTGDSHTCAVTTSGEALCWGRGLGGRLGTGDSSDEAIPAQVVGLSSGIISISAGNEHTCALRASGEALCWGSGFNGRLGNNNTSQQTTPVDVVWD